MGTKGFERRLIVDGVRLEPNTVDDIGSLVVQFKKFFADEFDEATTQEASAIVGHLVEMREAQTKASQALYLLAHKIQAVEGWEDIGEEVHGWGSALEGR